MAYNQKNNKLIKTKQEMTGIKGFKKYKHHKHAQGCKRNMNMMRKEKEAIKKSQKELTQIKNTIFLNNYEINIRLDT